jgi:ArsR family metal-binding transcriptional regulator
MLVENRKYPAWRVAPGNNGFVIAFPNCYPFTVIEFLDLLAESMPQLLEQQDRLAALERERDEARGILTDRIARDLRALAEEGERYMVVCRERNEARAEAAELRGRIAEAVRLLNQIQNDPTPSEIIEIREVLEPKGRG